MKRGKEISNLITIIRRNIFTINFLPIIFFHLILLPIWLLVNVFEELWVVTILSSIGTTIIIPFFQVVINGWFNIKCNNYRFIKNWTIISISTLLSHVLNYMNWGISSQSLLKPDSETLLILKWEIIISLLIVFIMSCIQQIELIKRRLNIWK